jgi:hypothetical protein
VLTVLLPVLVLAGLVFVAQRARRFETGFALLMGGGLFLTPVAWVHYFVLALPAFYLVFQRLGERGWPRWRTGLVVLSAGAISISEGLYFNWVEHFFAGQNAEGLPLVGALPALLTLIPLAAVSLLLWQMVALESPLEEPQDAAAPMADWQAATVRPEVLASP